MKKLRVVFRSGRKSCSLEVDPAMHPPPKKVLASVWYRPVQVQDTHLGELGNHFLSSVLLAIEDGEEEVPPWVLDPGALGLTIETGPSQGT